MTRLLLTLATLLAVTAAKPVVFEDPGLSVLNDALEAAAGDAHTRRTVTDYAPDVIPVDCHREALIEKGDGDTSPRCNVPDMEVFSVKYDDCAEPWVFCRCPDAPVTKENMMNQFGRLPPNLRAPIRHVMAFGGSGWAYQFAYDLVLLGDVPNLTVMTHEAAHGFDSDHSTRQEFLDAMNNDSCWADGYARNNGEATGDDFGPWEVWAQTLVMRRYQNSVGELPKDASCMQNQLNVVAQQTDAKLAEPVCDMSTKWPLE